MKKVKFIAIIFTTAFMLSCDNKKQESVITEFFGCEYFVHKNKYGELYSHKYNCKNPSHRESLIKK